MTALASVQTADDFAPIPWPMVAIAIAAVLLLAASYIPTWLRARRALRNLPPQPPAQPTHVRTIPATRQETTRP